jgi:hypothetical protein
MVDSPYNNPFGDYLANRFAPHQQQAAADPRQDPAYQMLLSLGFTAEQLDPLVQQPGAIDALVKQFGATTDVHYMPGGGPVQGVLTSKATGQNFPSGLPAQGPTQPTPQMGPTQPSGGPPQRPASMVAPVPGLQGSAGQRPAVAAPAPAPAANMTLSSDLTPTAAPSGAPQQSESPVASPTPQTQPAPAPASSGGFSSQFDPRLYDTLAGDPQQLAIQWLIKQGIDPRKANPRDMVLAKRGAQAKGQYYLTHALNSGPAGAVNAQDFLDWFGQFMGDLNKPGMAPLSMSAAQGDLKQALTQAQVPDSIWSNLLAGNNEAGSTGQGLPNAPTAQDQTNALVSLLQSAFGDSMDPAYLGALINQVQSAQGQYQSGLYEQPTDKGYVKPGQQFLDWLMSQGTLNSVLGG